MTVLLTISETVTGPEVSDVLAGTSIGVDLGQVVNGQFSPLSSQINNLGHQNIYVSHNATVDPITGLKLFVQTFSGTYGGANNASLDIATLLSYGAASSGSDKNNIDGLSRGLHMDQSYNVTSTSQFDPTRETSGQKRIFGKSYAGIDGSSLVNGFLMHPDAATYWDGANEIAPSAPTAGKVGKASDTVLGNRAHYRFRMYLHQAATEGGILQFDLVFAFSYTA